MINTFMKNGFWHDAPEYFSRWRVFPRAFITMYIYLLWKVSMWFMDLPSPTMEQAGFVSVIVGSGAAWFGLYVNSGNGFEVKVPSSGNQTPQQNYSSGYNTYQNQPQTYNNDYSNGYTRGSDDK